MRIFLFYRVTLALTMVFVFFVIERGPLGTHFPGLFSIGVLVYLTITAMSLGINLALQQQTERQSVVAVNLDIACIS